MSEKLPESQAALFKVIEDQIRKEIKSEGLPHLFNRLLNDSWAFAIELRNGEVIAARSIDFPIEAFGTWWVDVHLTEFDFSSDCRTQHLRIKKFVSEERDVVTVRIDEIAAIFELADT